MSSKLRRLSMAALAVMLALPVFGSATGVSPQRAEAKPKQRFTDLKKVPKPKITGAEIIEGLEEFVAAYPLRHSVLSDTPVGDGIPASEFLAEEAKKHGFKVRTIIYEGAGQAGKDIRVVEAVKKGTKKPNEWIAFIAHYDNVAGGGVTIEGAYDDGSGTNMLRYFGKAFSKVKTDRSIALLWFDAEETGLLASKRYAKELKEEGKIKIHAGMGFDMVGIGYPARYCICVYHGPLDAPLAEPIIDYVHFDFLKYPEGDGGPAATEKWPLGTEGHVCSCGPNIRNSDESSFAAEGWFTMRWTGMRTAADYPGYHQPWDTVDFMELVAGGRDILEEGTENTFKAAYYATHVLDKLP
ncbi:MAG: M28 family metallopeptidase [Actinomycetota bacterium]